MFFIELLSLFSLIEELQILEQDILINTHASISYPKYEYIHIHDMCPLS